MKKIITLLLSLLILAACSSTSPAETETTVTDDSEELVTITVSCTAEPHATILEFAKPLLEEKGYNLEIEILDNYYIFNTALDSGDVDANFFQHIVFLNNEVEEKGYKIVNAGAIHIEPFGFYSSKYESIDDIEDGATVIISNSISDHGRLLSMLEKAGLITLKEGIDVINATVEDIAENPKNLSFVEVNPELLASAYTNGDGDLVGINGNYAIGAGLNPAEDALILESAEDNPYVNVVACREGEENSDKIVALVETLKSDEVKQFVLEHYQNSVIPVE